MSPYRTACEEDWPAAAHVVSCDELKYPHDDFSYIDWMSAFGGSAVSTTSKDMMDVSFNESDDEDYTPTQGELDGLAVEQAQWEQELTGMVASGELAPIEDDEVAGLHRDAAIPIRLDHRFEDAFRETVGMGSLFVAGRSTASAFATRAPDAPMTVASRGGSGANQTWESGAASGPDRLVDGATPNGNHSTSFHAEEKVVKSREWDNRIRGVLAGVQATGQSGEVVVMINRSSCDDCADDLVQAINAVHKQMHELGLDPGKVSFTASVLGRYNESSPEALQKLRQAGWVVVVHAGADGAFTRVGIQQVGALLEEDPP